MDQVDSTIQNLIETNPIILFIKGSRTFPQCGFSVTVVKIFELMQIPYTTYNVLENEDVRQGIKSYSNWPTIPQVYINKEFIGGADIIIDLYQTGKLQERVEKVLAS
uniref:glutaredoxin n=1 Tax=Goniotrichopsis reniformis TaxID=468933 RepID=UPI001FCCC8B3|nr:glutaredoxin [Goniotrichopsis reniformis]UNJ14790.1 glutaredoxin [Goniotrichopsis reniformis]